MQDTGIYTFRTDREIKSRMGLLNIFNKPAPEIPQKIIQKVLVVDDEVDLRNFYQELLTQEGYEVLTASNGQEALNIVAQTPPNIILLDLMMPVMDGNEVMRRLWENHLTKTIPVIVLTNAGNLDNMDKANFYASYKFFIKANVSPEEIIETVKEALLSKLPKPAAIVSP